MKHAETALHIAIVNFLRLTLPEDAVLWHSASGEVRDKRTAAKLKAMGVVPGLCDLFIFWNRQLIGIEIKAPGGRLSKEQVEMHKRLVRAGAFVTVAYDIDAVARTLNSLKVPMKARLAA